MLLFASVVVAAYTVVLTLAAPSYEGMTPHVSPAVGAGVVLGVFWLAHFVLVACDHRGDPLLLPVAAMLVGLSCIEIDRLQPAQASHQVLWLLISFAAMLALMVLLRDYRRLEDYKYGLLLLAVLLQAAVMLFGTEVNGATLWIRFGSLLQFQPVELVKILLIGFLAAYLRQNRAMLTLGFRGEERRITLRYLLPLLAVAAVAEAIFVVQRDMGQGLLFFGIFLSMYYATTRRLGVILLTMVAFVAMSWACYHLFWHVRIRFQSWLDPWQDAAATGYQMVQALYALASGGWFGSGIWRGEPWRVPVASTDFIFVSITEEMGTVAAVAILACFALLVVRAFGVARQAHDDFGALLACGVASVLGCQVFVIVAGTIRMIPMTGITLPFMSYGGTSLVANFLMIGLLLEVSHRGQTSTESVDAAHEPRRVQSGLRVLSMLYALLLLAPAIYLVGFQLQSGDLLATSPANPRTREDLRGRGQLFDRRKARLAWTATEYGGRRVKAPWEDNGLEGRRHYAEGNAFGNLLGYRSFQYASAGLERALDDRLQGSVEPQGVWQALQLLAGRSLRGDDVILTIDASIQRQAYDALDKQKGAVVVLDPRSGEILALASSPGFDANRVDADWRHISSEAGQPLLNRALEGQYPPGSVIKPAIVALALDRGAIHVEDTFFCPGYLAVNGYQLHDVFGEVHGTLDVSGAVAYSCNVALGTIALRLGVDRLLDGLSDLGIGQSANPTLPMATGHLPIRSEVTPQMLAQMGFGQGPLLVTPLHVALFTAAIANHGRIMAPHLVRAVLHADGTLAKTVDAVWRTPFSAAAADAVVPMMEAVVERGTGTEARISGVRVAGKTGTAENPHGPPHSWFAAFAPADAPRVVVVTLVENGGWGAQVAAPMARDLLEAALRRVEK